MPTTIEIEVPFGTTVILPTSDTLSKSINSNLEITIENQSGEEISLNVAGSATSFEVDSPSSINDESSDSITLTFLTEGSIDFEYDEESESIAVEETINEEAEEIVESDYIGVLCSQNNQTTTATMECFVNECRRSNPNCSETSGWVAAITVCQMQNRLPVSQRVTCNDLGDINLNAPISAEKALIANRVRHALSKLK